MIARLSEWMVMASRRWWLVLALFLAQVVTMQLLFAVEDRFSAITGVAVFDTQNNLTAAMLLEQLARYTGAAADAYGWFALVDVVFPLVAAVFLGVAWALQLRLNRSPLAARLLERRLPAFPLLVALADWGENLALVVLVWLAPPSALLATAAVIAKRLKLTLLGMTMLGTGLLLLLLLGDSVSRWWRRRTGS